MLRDFNEWLVVAMFAGLLLVSSSASFAQSPLDTEAPKDPKLAKFYKELAEAEKARQDKAAQELAEKSPEGDPFKWSLALTIPGTGEWEWVGGAPDGSMAFFSTKRNATRVGAVATVWIRAEFRDRHSPQSTASWMEFNCTKNTVRTLHLMEYGKADLNEPTDTIPTPTLAAPILPGTVAEAWLEWACKNTKAKAPSPKP